MSPGHTLTLFLSQVNPQITIAISAIFSFSLLYMILGVMQAKGRWLASLGLKGYTKWAAWTVFLCHKHFIGTNWHNKPYFHGTSVSGSAWDGVREHGMCWTKYEAHRGQPGSWGHLVQGGDPLAKYLTTDATFGDCPWAPWHHFQSCPSRRNSPWNGGGSQGYFHAPGDRGEFLVCF